jgi:hypothetical protein
MRNCDLAREDYLTPHSETVFSPLVILYWLASPAKKAGVGPTAVDGPPRIPYKFMIPYSMAAELVRGWLWLTTIGFAKGSDGPPLADIVATNLWITTLKTVIEILDNNIAAENSFMKLWLDKEANSRPCLIWLLEQLYSLYTLFRMMGDCTGIKRRVFQVKEWSGTLQDYVVAHVLNGEYHVMSVPLEVASQRDVVGGRLDYAVAVWLHAFRSKQQQTGVWYPSTILTKDCSAYIDSAGCGAEKRAATLDNEKGGAAVKKAKAGIKKGRSPVLPLLRLKNQATRDQVVAVLRRSTSGSKEKSILRFPLQPDGSNFNYTKCLCVTMCIVGQPCVAEKCMFFHFDGSHSELDWYEPSAYKALRAAVAGPLKDLVEWTAEGTRRSVARAGPSGSSATAAPSSTGAGERSGKKKGKKKKPPRSESPDSASS